MALTSFAGGLPTDLTPAHKQSVLSSNYIDFHSTDFSQWTQQFLPELYEAEVEKYGNRTVGSFLRLVGAEMPMQSDQVIWSEQGRLHLSYAATLAEEGSGSGVNVITIADSGTHSVRAGQTIAIHDAGSKTAKAYVTEVTNTTITVKSYANALGLVAAGLNCWCS